MLIYIFCYISLPFITYLAFVPGPKNKMAIIFNIDESELYSDD